MRCCSCKKKDAPEANDVDENDDGMVCPLEKNDREDFNTESPYTSCSYPTKSPQHINCHYVRNLENEFEGLQKAFLSLTTHFARLQFRLRQIMQAAPEERFGLLCDLERIAFEGVDDKTCLDELPRIQRDIRCMGDVRRKVNIVIDKLRSQLVTLSEASELEVLESCDDEPQKNKARRRRSSDENNMNEPTSNQQPSQKGNDVNSKTSNHKQLKPNSEHSMKSNQRNNGELNKKGSSHRSLKHK